MVHNEPANATRLAAARGLEQGQTWSEYKHLPELYATLPAPPGSIDADFAGYTPPKLSQGWAVGYNVIVGWFVGLGIT